MRFVKMGILAWAIACSGEQLAASSRATPASPQPAQALVPDLQQGQLRSSAPWDAFPKQPLPRPQPAVVSDLRTCLEKVKTHESLATILEKRKARLRELIEQVKARKSLSKKMRQKMIEYLKHRLTMIEEMLAGMDSWKCSDLPVFVDGKVMTVDIRHPAALNFYYRECLGRQLSSLRSKMEEIVYPYKDVDTSNVEQVCKAIASHPQITKKLDEHQIQIILLSAQVEDLQESFDAADACHNSIMTWLREKSPNFCNNNIVCQKAWDHLIRRTNKAFSLINKNVAEMRVKIEKIKHEFIKKSVIISSYSVMCY